jgi:ferritin-like metal-binding protein YciE
MRYEGAAAMSISTLNDLFIEQVTDLYDAEQQLVKALPKMAAAASSAPLKRAFEQHLKETEQHVTRLEQVFESVDQKKKRKHCVAMEGLIAEGDEVISMKGASALKDVALVAAAQRVEHYEIAGYGNVRAFAEQLGYDEVCDVIDKTLYEEGEANRILTKITQEGLLEQAHNV